MRTETHASSPLAQRLITGVVALGAAMALALAASGAASAQAPGTPPAATPPATAPPAIPGLPAVGPLTVDLSNEDDELERGERGHLNIAITNNTLATVTDASVDIDVDDEISILGVTSGGPKELTDSDSDSRSYTLGPIAPLQTVRFDVIVKISGEDINRSDLGDDFDVNVETQSAGGGSDADDEIKLRDDN